MKEYIVLQAVKDADGYDHIIETVVRCKDPVGEIWLNIDEFPNILSVKEVKR